MSARRRVLAVAILVTMFLSATACGGSGDDDGTPGVGTPSSEEASGLLVPWIEACTERDEAALAGMLSPSDGGADEEAIRSAVEDVASVAAVEGPLEIEIDEPTDSGTFTVRARFLLHIDARLGDQGALATFAVEEEVAARTAMLDDGWALTGLPDVETFPVSVVEGEPPTWEHTGCPGAVPTAVGAFSLSGLVQSGDIPVPTTEALEPGEYGQIGTPIMIVTPEDWVRADP